MRYEVRFAPAAQRALHMLERYLAKRFYPVQAANYVEALYNHCIDLATFPLRGSVRQDYGPEIRVMGYKDEVTILFKVDQQRGRVTILRIAYRGRSTRL